MPSKFFCTKVTTSSTLGASIFQMVFHKYTRNHRSAFVTTWNRIMFACVQMCLINARFEFVCLSILIFSNNKFCFIILPSAFLIHPTIYSHPCDVCSIQLNSLLPSRPPCLGRSEKDQNDER